MKIRFNIPKSLKSQSVWRDPIRLLDELGLLSLNDDRWLNLDSKEALVSYIDSEVEPIMTMAPGLNSVPIPLDDITSLFIRPAIRGEKDLSPSDIVSSLLRREFELGNDFDKAFLDLIWWLNGRNQYPGLALLFSME